MVSVGRPVIIMKVHSPFLVNPNLQILELYTDKKEKQKEKRERGNLAYNLFFNHLPIMPK